MGVPGGGDGDEDGLEGEGLAAGPELVEAAVDLLAGVAVAGLVAVVVVAEEVVGVGGGAEDLLDEEEGTAGAAGAGGARSPERAAPATREGA